ncbi:MAG: LuxR C-terminal-related transcriptional regulator, partial [Spirochaetota bacterium]
VYTILRHRLFLYQADSSRRLLDSLEGMLVVTDTDLRIVSVNPAAAGIMKSNPSDLRGKKLPDILSFSDEEAVRLSGFTAGEITRVTLFPELGMDRLTVDLTAIQDDAGAPLLYLISLRQAAPGPDIFSGSGLTKREQEIIRLLLKGKTNPQIADELCISLATVKTHLFKAFRKLGVDNRHEVFSLLSSDPR